MPQCTRPLRNVLFIAPQFPPCNLTAGHRTRLFVRHLPEFGYRPVVITLRRECYETRLDLELEKLVAPEVEVIRTRALPTRPFHFVGDLGIRSLPFHLAAIRRLVRTRIIDLLFFTIFPGYTSLIGPITRLLYGLPYVIDYQDPWVSPPSESQKRSWKARLSHLLARTLEPIALSRVSGVMGVAEGYYSGVLQRHPRISRLPTAGIPLGGEPADHAYIEHTGRQSAMLLRPDLTGKLVFVYAGTYWEPAARTFKTLLAACQQLRKSDPLVRDNLRLLFVGTGSRQDDPAAGQIAPIARDLGAQGWVVEVADRKPYAEVLSTLHGAHAVMILGSTERSYTASKTFQALLSGRPILAVLHTDSSAAEILSSQAGVELVRFSDQAGVETKIMEIANAVAKILRLPPRQAIVRNQTALEPLSAHAMTRRLAAFFDVVLARQANRGPAT